jgi:hypothetical protein
MPHFIDRPAQKILCQITTTVVFVSVSVCFLMPCAFNVLFYFVYGGGIRSVQLLTVLNTYFTLLLL